MKARAKLVLPAPSGPDRVSTSPDLAWRAKTAASAAVAASSASMIERWAVAPSEVAGMRPFSLFAPLPEASDGLDRVCRGGRRPPRSAGPRGASAERPPDMLGELGLAVGLADDGELLLGAIVGRERLHRVTRGEQDLDVLAQLARLPRQLNAADAIGHDDVGEEQVDRLVALEDRHRLDAVIGDEDAIAEIAQRRHRDIEHVGIVLDDQHRFRSFRLHPRPGGLDLRCRPCRHRQIDRDRRAAADLAGDLDGTAALAHEPIELAKAKPAAFADLLGRVERLEGAFE